MASIHGRSHSPDPFLPGLDRLGRPDAWAMLALIALVVLSSLIPGQTTFYNSDQAELAFALDDYDVGVEHPHPPGNPLYVAMAKVVHVVTGDALRSLQAVSAILRLGAVLGLYWVAALLYGRRVALAASSLWVFLPALWSVGVTTFTWAADACFSALIAGACLKAKRGNAGHVVLSAVLIAIGLGFRESMVLLVPLWAFCVWRQSRRAIVTGVLLAAVVVAVWATGMVIATGSWERYATARAALTEEVVKPTTVLFSGRPVERLLANWGRLTDCILGYGSKLLALAWLLPMVYAVGRAFGLQSLRTDYRAWFIALWWVPSVAFYALFHVVHVAHILIFLPAWIVAAGVGLVLLVDDTGWHERSRRHRAVFAGLLACAALYSLAGILFVARPTIRREQAETDSIVNCIRDHFDPGATFLVQARARRQFRALMYRLPEFEGKILQQTFGDTARPSMSFPSPLRLGDGVEFLVVPETTARIYVPTDMMEVRPQVQVRWRKLAPDERYLHFDRRGLWTSSSPDQTDPPSPVPLESAPADAPTGGAPTRSSP